MFQNSEYVIPYNDDSAVDNKVSDAMDISGNIGRPDSAG